MEDPNTQGTSGAGITGTADTDAAAAASTSGTTAATEGTASTSTPVEIPAHLQDAFPAGTTVEQTDDGQLKATVPGETTETESAVHHFFVSIEHGIEHLAEKVKAFFGGDSSDDSSSDTTAAS